MTKPLIISADDIKQYFPKYKPTSSSDFHYNSAKVADKRLKSAIKHIDNEVVLLGGGAASGKTEYLNVFLDHNKVNSGTFFDGTLPTIKGAEIKINSARKSKREIEIHYVFPNNMKKSYQAFLHRDRKYDSSHFIRTHIESRKTILNIAKKYKKLKIKLVESSKLDNGSMSFKIYIFKQRKLLIQYLEKLQINKQEINEIII